MTNIQPKELDSIGILVIKYLSKKTIVNTKKIPKKINVSKLFVIFAET